MVRRLARGKEAKAEGLHVENGSRKVSGPDALGRESGQSTEPYEAALAIAEAARRISPKHGLAVVAKQFAVQLQAQGSVEIAALSLAASWKATASDGTRHAYIGHLMRLLRSISPEKAEALRPFLPQPREGPARLVTASDEDYRHLLQTPDPLIRTFVALAGVLALRLAEACSAHEAGWNRQRHELTVRTKGGREKAFAVPESVAEVLASLPEGEGTFLARAHGGPVSPRNMSQHWRRFRAKAGYPPNLNPHDLRRTAAVRLYRETQDILAVQKLLGHEDLTNTARYLLPYAPEAMKAILDAAAWTPRYRPHHPWAKAN